MRENLSELDEEFLFADGFDEAIIGSVSVFSSEGQAERVLYDIDLCREILIKDGMSFEEADEYLSFNVLGAYVGPRTPAFARISPGSARY